MNLEELILESIQDYIHLCDKLMGYSSMSYTEKSKWIGNTHGFHIRFKQKYSNQIIEAPYSRIKTKQDLEPHFWLIFIQTTSNYNSIEIYLEQNNISAKELLNNIIDESYFQNRQIKIPNVKAGDLIQLRKSIFNHRFNTDQHWDLSYYYEDQFEHIYWPIENNFEDRGNNLLTILGGIITQVQK